MVKPGAKALAKRPELNEGEANSLLAAYRELVTERANHIIAREIRSPRGIAAKYSQAVEREREITKFYKRFSEAGADHLRRSRAELNEYLSAGEDLKALLVRWHTERVAQIVAREVAKWE